MWGCVQLAAPVSAPRTELFCLLYGKSVFRPSYPLVFLPFYVLADRQHFVSYAFFAGKSGLNPVKEASIERIVSDNSNQISSDLLVVYLARVFRWPVLIYSGQFDNAKPLVRVLGVAWEWERLRGNAGWLGLAGKSEVF